MVIKINEIEKYKKVLGSKTLKLKDLKDLGFWVPDFVAISSDYLTKIIGEEGKIKQEDLKNLKNTIASELKCKRYAIRSSSLIEDSESQSHAGQFQTELNVDIENISNAIQKVVGQAYDYLNGDIGKFSLIIQEHIKPDISGVTFTRDPFGDREMIIEYYHGSGDNLVGGKIDPHKKQLYWNSVGNEDVFKNFNQAVDAFKKIELYYNFPQDIEWCMRCGVLYFLQSRPITSISQNQYDQIKYLDKIFSGQNKFYFEKTGISEIAPRPVAITFVLLKEIYKKNGPVDNVYKKYKINYSEKNFLKIFGNELYVDKELELKSLFPAKSFLLSKDIKSNFDSFSGLLITFKNIKALNAIKIKNYLELFDIIKLKIEKPDFSSKNISDFIKNFLNDYEIVFEINFLAGLLMNRLEAFLVKEKEIKLALLASCVANLIPEISDWQVDFDDKILLGNSLDVADHTKFFRNNNCSIHESQKVNKWWDDLSDDKKDELKNVLFYNHLREVGRWLVVQKINQFRKILITIAQEKKFKNIEDIYFANLNELLDGNLLENECVTRKEEYLKYDNFNLPRVITSQFALVKSDELVGVSLGLASGVLVKVDDLNNDKYKNKKKILYTDVLSPDLVQYFDQINGIVSATGGLLSHLAIIAREKSLPVVSNFNLKKSEIKIGDEVEIDGEKGSVVK